MRKERFVSRTWLSEYSECKGAEYQKLASRQGTTQRVSWKTLLRSRRQAFRERADGLIPIQWMIGARCTDERQLIQSRPRNSGELCIPSLCHSHRHAVLPESTLCAARVLLHALGGWDRMMYNNLVNNLWQRRADVGTLVINIMESRA
mgnify:CR=1 FL=1